MSSADLLQPSSSRNNQPRLVVNVDDRHPFDLDAYAGQFEGRTLISRLARIHSLCPSLRPLTSALALPLIKEQTFDLNAFDHFEGEPNDPWRTGANRLAGDELEKLETELKSVTANLIKESIRICNLDLGKLYLKTGDPVQALKCFIKTREFTTTAAQILEMSMLVIEVNIELRAWLQLAPYIIKAESALDRPPPPLGSTSSSVPLSAAQARAKEEEALKREEEKTRVGTRLQVARGLASLGQGVYEKAARELLGVKGDLGDWGRTVISPAELAIVASLCALATLRRSALKSELLFNDGFRAFVDEEPHVRELVDSFVEGKYKKTLEMMEKHSSQHLLIPYLTPHLANLTSSIRRLALIQYFKPFQAVRLGRMAEAFGLDEEVLLVDVVDLVRSGEIEGRLDLHDRVLRAHTAVPREKLFREALDAGERAEASTRRAMLRMKLIEEGLVVTDASKITTRKKASGATGAGDEGVEDDVIVYGEELVA